MKKKLLSILVAVACALSCAFGLVACSDDNAGTGDNNGTTNEDTADNGTGSDSKDDNNSTDGDKNDDNTTDDDKNDDNTTDDDKKDDDDDDNGDKVEVVLTEDTDFDALISDKVSEAEWLEIFTDANFMNVTLKEIKHGKQEDDYEPMYMIRECTQSKWSYCVPGYNTTVFENDIYTNYMYMNDAWYFMGGECTREQIEELGQSWFFTFELIACNIREYYSEFTYDEALGAYVYSGEGIRIPTKPFEWMATDFEYMEVKFVGGKLASFRWKNYYYDNDVKKILNDVSYLYFNYGTSVVSYPENAQPFPMGPEE